jgi:queuine tRNA-ribosyltransferase
MRAIATMARLHFEVTATAAGSRARAGRLRTLHGEVLTPVFMPVGTHAAVRGLPVEDLEAAGAQVLLANAYHLILRPGTEVFSRLGGIHRFMNWSGSVLTDSGGYQVFSLATECDHGGRRGSQLRRRHTHPPRAPMKPRRPTINDIMMALTYRVHVGSREGRRRDAPDYRWAARSLAARRGRGRSSASCRGRASRPPAGERRGLTRLPFDGFAIGGLAVEGTGTSASAVRPCGGLLPRDRLLVGRTPIDRWRPSTGAWTCSTASFPRRWRSRASPSPRPGA